VPIQWLLRRRLLKRLPPLDQVRTVLVMCTANRVRSPFAAAVLSRAVPQIQVSSRGVIDGGSGCPGESIDAAAPYGIDLAPHVARKVTPAELLHADLLVTMEVRMAHELVTKYPALSDKVAPLRLFHPERSRVADIDDPYLLPPSEYVEAYALIARCCTGLAARLSTGVSRE
jgi:protein-tyrosine phosphatase